MVCKLAINKLVGLQLSACDGILNGCIEDIAMPALSNLNKESHQLTFRQ